MSEKLQIEVVPVDSPKAAAEWRLISCAAMTDSIDPVVYAELLEQGMCLCTVTNAEMSPVRLSPGGPDGLGSNLSL